MFFSFSLTAFVSATSVSLFVSIVLARLSVLTRSVMPMYFAPSSVASFCAVVVFPTPGVPVTRMAWVIFHSFCLCYGYVVFFVLQGLWCTLFLWQTVRKGLKGFK
jgi:hypothetical protein